VLKVPIPDAIDYPGDFVPTAGCLEEFIAFLVLNIKVGLPRRARSPEMMTFGADFTLKRLEVNHCSALRAGS
jgi:hypothetical protein